jgi:hypothetical protein
MGAYSGSAIEERTEFLDDAGNSRAPRFTMLVILLGVRG